MMFSRALAALMLDPASFFRVEICSIANWIFAKRGGGAACLTRVAGVMGLIFSHGMLL